MSCENDERSTSETFYNADEILEYLKKRSQEEIPKYKSLDIYEEERY